MDTVEFVRLVVLDESSNLLLFRLWEKGVPPYWAAPGGEIRPDEAGVDAAARMLQEETGLSLKIGSVVMETDDLCYLLNGQCGRCVDKYFVVNAHSNSVINPPKNKEFKWWGLNEMKTENIDVRPNWMSDLFESVIHSVDESKTGS